MNTACVAVLHFPGVVTPVEPDTVVHDRVVTGFFRNNGRLLKGHEASAGYPTGCRAEIAADIVPSSR